MFLNFDALKIVLDDKDQFIKSAIGFAGIRSIADYQVYIEFGHIILELIDTLISDLLKTMPDNSL